MFGFHHGVFNDCWRTVVYRRNISTGGMPSLLLITSLIKAVHAVYTPTLYPVTRQDGKDCSVCAPDSLRPATSAITTSLINSKY